MPRAPSADVPLYEFVTTLRQNLNTHFFVHHTAPLHFLLYHVTHGANFSVFFPHIDRYFAKFGKVEGAFDLLLVKFCKDRYTFGDLEPKTPKFEPSLTNFFVQCGVSLCDFHEMCTMLSSVSLLQVLKIHAYCE